jgi:hypothetical protein
MQCNVRALTSHQLIRPVRILHHPEAHEGERGGGQRGVRLNQGTLRSSKWNVRGQGCKGVCKHSSSYVFDTSDQRRLSEHEVSERTAKTLSPKHGCNKGHPPTRQSAARGHSSIERRSTLIERALHRAFPPSFGGRGPVANPRWQINEL